MSLDVYLHQPVIKVTTEAKIYVRLEGSITEITRADWDKLYPGREPVTVPTDESESDEVFWANITHNLGRMASEAGIYEPLWRPEEIGITKASQMIEPLEKGLVLLRSDPVRFEKFNSENGWGLYENFVPWVSKYLEACKQYPDAIVSVSR